MPQTRINNDSEECFKFQEWLQRSRYKEHLQSHVQQKALGLGKAYTSVTALSCAPGAKAAAQLVCGACPLGRAAAATHASSCGCAGEGALFYSTELASLFPSSTRQCTRLHVVVQLEGAISPSLSDLYLWGGGDKLIQLCCMVLACEGRKQGTQEKFAYVAAASGWMKPC
eukprot:1160939-Pelagomonas_calceolata.AAC.5